MNLGSGEVKTENLKNEDLSVLEDPDDPGIEISLPEITNSSFHDLDNSNVLLEEVLLGKEVLELPSDLFTNPQIFSSIFSMDTWQGELSEEVRAHLSSMLPNFPRDDASEKAKTLKMLFGGSEFAFGSNPLETFRQDLMSGRHQPERRQMEYFIRQSHSRDAVRCRAESQYHTLHQVLRSRKQLLESVSKNPISLPLSVQKMEKNKVRLTGGMRVRIRKKYLEEIARVKREVGEDEQEDGYSSDDMELVRDLLAREDHREVNLLLAADTGSTTAAVAAAGGKMGVGKMAGDGREARVRQQGEEEEGVGAAPPTAATTAASLNQETHACFFSLVRDLFLLGEEGRLTMPQLDSALSAWQESPIAALNDWYPLCQDASSGGWRGCIPSAVAFLCGSFPDQVPANFTPAIVVESSTGSYQWVAGEGGEGSDASLTHLTDWWLVRKDSCKAGYFSQKLPQGHTSTPTPLNTGVGNLPPGNSTSWTTRPSTAEERLHYQQQERQRYLNPTVAFEWAVQDYRACVGPVKGAGAIKAKPHNMLIQDRPACVTILTLVRDAVSRLPNGEGSRTDIIELLKDSQYLRENIETSNLTTTVSGALDRLQNEKDPCLKYDGMRKIWTYLHRYKTRQDYEEGGVPTPTPPARQRSRKKFKIEHQPVVGDEMNMAGGGEGAGGAGAGGVLQRVVVKGPDGQVIPLSAATLQKLIQSGAIKPGNHLQVDPPGIVEPSGDRV